MNTRDLTQSSFEEATRTGIVLVDWWASWCGPCKAFAPIYESVAAEHPDIVFAKVDTDAEPRLASTYGIRAIPTLMAFRDGHLLFAQPGLMPKPALRELIRRLRELDASERNGRPAAAAPAHARDVKAGA